MDRDLFVEFERINEALKTAKKIFITAHENPDPDAVGSVLALKHIFEKQNKEVFCYLPTPPQVGLNFLSGFSDIKINLPSSGLQDFDLFFCLDYGDFKRLRLPNNIDEQKIITIDHHLKGDQRGKIKIIEQGASSTAEIIYLWLKICGMPLFSNDFSINFISFNYETRGINKDIATCLLAGIISDTGGFSHVTCSAQTLKIVSKLITAGAPLAKTTQQVFGLKNTQSLSKIWGEVLSRVKINEKAGMVYSWLYADDLEKYRVNMSDLEGISSLLSTISEARMSLFLVEIGDNMVQGSLRSEPHKGVAVSYLAEALGGGGHIYAAGFKQQGTIDDVLKKVLELVG